MTTRKISVVTATRAEYGLLYWLLNSLRSDDAIELQLLVSGTHLSDSFGMTVHQIEKDGFPISARIPIPLDEDSTKGITRAIGIAVEGFGVALETLKPDVLVLLGDRYEMLAAAQAAMVARIPIAHIHGGELTEGLIDEAIRHSITKMSHMHFVAAEEFRHRVIQLGEVPERVWTVGATGLDNIARLQLMGCAQLEENLGVQLREPSFLVTYHPVTLSSDDQGKMMRLLLELLDELEGTIIVTGVNADPGNQSVRQEAQKFALARPDRVLLVESLGVLRYLSAMAHVDAVIGNSSSGLIEAPAIGTPTIDIGDRQSGRLRAPSVIHSSEDAQDIRSALKVVLSAEHKVLSDRRQTPYGCPGAALRIASVIRDYPLEGLIMKRFYDIPWSEK